jgi:predicted CXXCH cytochrome family protein
MVYNFFCYRLYPSTSAIKLACKEVSMALVRFSVFFICLLLPFSVFAYGGHDSLSCTGCHSIHDAKGEVIFAVPANKKDINAKTKQPFTDITSLCLGCHEDPEKGGMGIKPISSHISHPYGLGSVNPKVAHVPQDLLRNGQFECVGCHDPHPSNPNYRYLRVDTAGGSSMVKFCALCHPMKADPKSVGEKPALFSSMDESEGGAPAAPAAPQKKSTGQKKPQ